MATKEQRCLEPCSMSMREGTLCPAKAAYECALRSGHTGVEDMFAVLNSPFWQWFCRAEWRFLLRHPQLERCFHATQDTRFTAYLLSTLPLILPVRKAFMEWHEATNPDFILCTNFLGGTIITAIAKKEKLKTPIFVYAADVFTTLSRIQSQNRPNTFHSHGKEKLYRQGYIARSRWSLPPFPCNHPCRQWNNFPDNKQDRCSILRIGSRSY